MELQFYQKKTPDIMEEISTRKDLSPYWCTNSIQGNFVACCYGMFLRGGGRYVPEANRGKDEEKR